VVDLARFVVEIVAVLVQKLDKIQRMIIDCSFMSKMNCQEKFLVLVHVPNARHAFGADQTLAM
jgi:hypothetical protein